MLFIAYWKDKSRNTYHGFIKADNRYQAKKMLENSFQKDAGCYVTHIYKADEKTRQSIRNNSPRYFGSCLFLFG